MMAEDSEKPDDENPSSSVEAPEVEAEIVTDDDVASSSAEINDGFSNEDEAPSAPLPPKKANKLPRALILGAGLVALIGVGFVGWRLLHREAQPVLPTDVVSEQQQPVETPEAIPDETTPPPDNAETSPGVDSKISNDIAAAKENLPDAPEEGPSADETFLPPLPSTDKIEAGNQNLQDVAKAALGMSGPLTGEEESSVIAPDKEQSDAPVFEIEDAGELTPGNLQWDAREPGEVSSAIIDSVENSDIDNAEAITPEETGNLTSVGAAPAPISDQNFAKIDNDIEAIKETFREEIADLKASLADARENDASQRAEIEAMRRDFQAALKVRDERASTEIAAITSRLDKIQNDDGITAGRRAAATIALSALQRVLETGGPYARELNVLAEYAPSASELTVLRRYAVTGAPTMRVLQSEFGNVARVALATDSEDTTGFMGKLSARARNMISLRPAKPTVGAGAPAIISRAEDHIKNGRISACIAELEDLPAPAQAAISDWMEMATARAELDDAVAALFARFTAPIR